MGALSASSTGCGSNDAPPGSAAGAKSGDLPSASAGTGGASSAAGAPNTAGAPNAAGASSGGATNNGSGADCAHEGDGRTTIVFVNGCTDTVTFRGSDIEGGMLAPGAASCVDVGSDVEALSAKRYWGFRGEDPGAEHHSLAEFTFNTDFYDFDWYNISYVDAFNLPLRITPLARPKCKTLTCASDLLPECPAEGRFRDSRGNLVACVSPNRNDGMSPVALYFEACDDAYAWSGDDQNGSDPSPVRSCAGEDWQIAFCPGSP